MNNDLKRFHEFGQRIHKRDWLKSVVSWFLVWFFGAAFGYWWAARAYGIFG